MTSKNRENSLRNFRVIYMRDPNTIIQKQDDTQTRGTPIAIIVSFVDREKNYIKYAFAAAHPKDVFNKKRALDIAKERLNGIDSRGNMKSVRKKNGMRMITDVPFNSETVLTGHEINKLIMRDLFSQKDTPERVRNFAGDWLARANDPKPGSKSVILPPANNTLPGTRRVALDGGPLTSRNADWHDRLESAKTKNLSPKEFTDLAAEQFRKESQPVLSAAERTHLLYLTDSLKIVPAAAALFLSKTSDRVPAPRSATYQAMFNRLNASAISSDANAVIRVSDEIRAELK